MTREEAEKGRDNMEMEGCEPQSPQGKDVTSKFIIKTFNPSFVVGKLFPHEDIFKWMSYGNDGKHPGCNQSYFGRREFSFTLIDGIYWKYRRYQPFSSLSEMKKSINEIWSVKIDIGPVYNVDILWVHSGQRSVHCWDCDGKARRLNNEKTVAIADFFCVYKLSLWSFGESGRKTGSPSYQKTLRLFDGGN